MGRHPIDLEPPKAANWDPFQLGQRMRGGQEDRQRFEPNEDMLDGRRGWCVEPFDPSEDDIEAASCEAFEGGPSPAGVTTAEVDAGRPGACQVEDPRPRESSAAHEIDHRRFGGRHMDIGPDRVVARNEVPSSDEQPLTIRRQGHATSRSHEQGRAQLRLEPLDLATERLLGHVQARRSAGEVELLCRRHEVAQGTDLELVADRPTGSIHAFPMVIGDQQVLDALAQASEGVAMKS